MKILNLKAENIKKLIAVDITPDDNTVVISGKNGAGKSSVLDSIFWALAGAKHIQDQPIRNGEEKAYIRLDLGRLVVERRFTEKNSYLYVTTEEGAKFSNGQEVLDKLIGAITFDPLEFSRLPAKKQYDTIRGMAKIDVDLEALDKANKEDFEERTLVNRLIKEVQAKLTTPGADEDALPEEKINVSDIANKLVAVRQDLANRTNLEKNIDTKTAAVLEAENRLKILTQERDALLQQLEGAPSVQMLETKIENLQNDIGAHEYTNAQIVVRDIRIGLQKEIVYQTGKAEELTAKMAAREAEKQKAIDNAQLPIDGLTLSDGNVLFKGIPFEQCSSAEQLRISTSIAMASNPELRVIRIKDGSLLDDEGMAMMKAMAKDKDFQVWIERVGADPMAIVIEDGQVQGGV